MITLLAFALLAAQDLETRVLVSRTSARPGDEFHAAVELGIPDGWHLYGPGEATGTPLALSPAENPHVKFGAPIYPEARRVTEGTLAGSWVVEGTAYVFIPLRVKPTAPAGDLALEFALDFQMCTNELCLLPDRRTLIGTLAVGPAQPRPVHPEVFARLPTAPPAPTRAETSAEREFRERGLGWLLAASLLGGLVTLLMPCVYPLVPITLNYFLKQGEGSRARGLALAAAYGLGIVLSFTAIGLGLSILLGPDGARRFAANPWVNLAVAALFLAFALSFFGLFELALPASITNRLAGGGPKRGLGGAFVLGTLFTVVTFTCTLPVAGVVLALAAGTAHRWAALLGMLAYSGTMAAPFLLLGLFPGLLGKVPRSGGWLALVKVATGILELGLALMYVANADQTWEWGILTRPVMTVAWALVCAGIAVYVLAGGLRWIKVAAGRVACAALGVALFGVGALFASGAGGRASLGPLDIVLPPPKSDAFESLAEALPEARRTGRPVFVEFTGVT